MRFIRLQLFCLLIIMTNYGSFAATHSIKSSNVFTEITVKELKARLYAKNKADDQQQAQYYLQGMVDFHFDVSRTYSIDENPHSCFHKVYSPEKNTYFLPASESLSIGKDMLSSANNPDEPVSRLYYREVARRYPCVDHVVDFQHGQKTTVEMSIKVEDVIEVFNSEDDRKIQALESYVNGLLDAAFSYIWLWDYGQICMIEKFMVNDERYFLDRKTVSKLTNEFLERIRTKDRNSGALATQLFIFLSGKYPCSMYDMINRSK